MYTHTLLFLFFLFLPNDFCEDPRAVFVGVRDLGGHLRQLGVGGRTYIHRHRYHDSPEMCRKRVSK